MSMCISSVQSRTQREISHSFAAMSAESYLHVPSDKLSPCQTPELKTNEAVIESQTGPLASRAFTTISSGPNLTYLSHTLLICSGFPLPLSVRYCRCRRTLNSFGDHCAACATSGISRSRAGPLERAAASVVCREAGARVATHVLVSDLIKFWKRSLSGFPNIFENESKICGVRG